MGRTRKKWGQSPRASAGAGVVAVAGGCCRSSG